MHGASRRLGFAACLAAVTLVLGLTSPSPTASAAARHCASLNAGGYRISGVRVFGIPCSLGRAAVRGYARKGFPDTAGVRFMWGSGRAEFGCLLYSPGVGPDGRCKGGVTKRNGRVHPYGTVDWKRRRWTGAGRGSVPKGALRTLFGELVTP